MKLFRQVKDLGKNKAWLQAQIKKFHSSNPNKMQDNGIGLLFDIDGVIMRGKKLIPAAKHAMECLTDDNGKFVVPTVFVTNAGNSLCETKAEKLSSILDMEISKEQVMLSHSPLRMFTEYHDKCVLLSGQGPIEEIAKRIGFTNTVTINDIRSAYPFLDMVSHTPKPAEPSKYTTETLPIIDAVVLMGEPTNWETNLQLIIDILMTNGSLSNDTSGYGEQRVPVLACNMDLQWMSEFSQPRFGHGMFLHCLESVYMKLVGRPLMYSALVGKPSSSTYQYAQQLVLNEAQKIGLKTPIHTLYAIGDNPMADIYGANLYNRILQRKAVCPDESRQVITASCNENKKVKKEPKLLEQTVKTCHSVLVCTGVYANTSNKYEQSAYTTPPVFHGPRDMDYDRDLCEPDLICQDAHEAVRTILDQNEVKRSDKSPSKL